MSNASVKFYSVPSSFSILYDSRQWLCGLVTAYHLYHSLPFGSLLYLIGDNDLPFILVCLGFSLRVTMLVSSCMLYLMSGVFRFWFVSRFALL